MNMKHLLLALLLMILVSGCVGASGTQEFSAAIWEYRIETTLTGSRSEGRVGRLYLNGKELHPYFDTMIIDSQLYAWKQRIHLWDFGGYEVTGEVPVPSGGIQKLVSIGDLKNGWYEASYETRRKHTPSQWIWVSTGEVEAWLNPAQIEEFITAYSIRPLRLVKK